MSKKIDAFFFFYKYNLGRLVTKTIQKCLSESYEIIDDLLKIGKDYNNFLCIFLK